MTNSRLASFILSVTLFASTCGAQAPIDNSEPARNEGEKDSAANLPNYRVDAARESIPPPESALASSDSRQRRPSGRLITRIPRDAKYVSPYGDDTGPGTKSRPWRSILLSFQKLNPGDTLVIRGGVYTASGSSTTCQNGNSPFGLVGKQGDEQTWTTVMGYPGERPILFHPDGWQTLYICESSFVRIEHLEVSGSSNSGNTSPVSGVYIIGSHHVVVRDVWSHDNGGCGICTSQSNHIVIDGNRVWGNARWNPYHTSGISLFLASNDGGGDNPDGYSNYITGNLVWNNYEDESLGIGQAYGVTDGNGIIIDTNNESGGNGRTLVKNNVLVDNGGPGVMLTRSHSVDIVENSLYENVRTRVETVVNNGDIGCNGSYDLNFEKNVVVPRRDNPHLFRGFDCSETFHADNVWVRTGAPMLAPGDIVLPTGTQVFCDPRLFASEGCWSPVGIAEGHGAANQCPGLSGGSDTDN